MTNPNPDLLAFEGELKRASKDIHERCGVDLNILWDDGKYRMTGATHEVKVWNGLGTVHFQIGHGDLMERGNAYRLFLEKVASDVRQKLVVQTS